LLRGLATGAVLAGLAQIEVTAEASPGMKVSEIHLLADGAPVAVASGSAASFSWDTAAVQDGAHDLSAKAVDEIGNSSTTSPVRIAVKNARGGVGGCASAGAEQPLVALAAAMAALLRRRRYSI
jgi:uncharacterized protein (TIGR03382 family)